jgi:hypothetical protein
MSDKAYQSKSTGGASGTFQGQTGMRLESTDYGQAAMILDVTGRLASRSQGRTRPTVAWGGKPPSEQTDYVDRD